MFESPVRRKKFIKPHLSVQHIVFRNFIDKLFVLGFSLEHVRLVLVGVFCEIQTKRFLQLRGRTTGAGRTQWRKCSHRADQTRHNNKSELHGFFTALFGL
jgi:hypothetical protein